MADDKRETGRDAYEREATTDLKDATPDQPKGMPLHTRILIGLLVGVVAGVAANKLLGGDHWFVAGAIRHVTEPVGTLFLRLLLMIVVPLVFSSLVVGVAGIGDIRRARARRPEVVRLHVRHLGDLGRHRAHARQHHAAGRAARRRDARRA